MRGRNGILMLAAMMVAAAGGNSPFMTDYPERRKLSDEEMKRRAHALNPVDLTEHEFIIKGEKIMASNKKTAMKIYANRHPESKKRKKK